MAVLLLAAGLLAAAPYLHAVDDGGYGVLVPTTKQWADTWSEETPGGFAALSADGPCSFLSGSLRKH